MYYQRYNYQYPNYPYPGGPNPYGYPVYNNGFVPGFIPKDPIINREARHLTKLSILAGAGLLGYVVSSFAFPFILKAFDLYPYYNNSYIFRTISTVMLSIFGIMLPFFIVSLFYSKEDRAKCIDFGKPVSSRAFWLAVGAGLMICLAGNYLSGGLEGFASAFGIDFKEIDSDKPGNAIEFLFYALETAVTPAIVEEFAIRGVVMQPLRKYGDRFAIVMSSFIFALMHGNMVQIPFAFVAGIALGYFAVSTRSIWTSVAIHFANNFASVILSVLSEDSPVANFLSVYALLIIYGVGIFCLFRFIRTEHYGLGLTAAPKGKKVGLTVAFIFFFLTSFLVSIGLPVITFYLLSFVFLALAYSSYKNANRQMLGSFSVSGLPEKLKISLYSTTPSVLTGIFFLICFTAGFINTTSFLGSSVFILTIMAIIAFVVCMLVTVISSKLLESKKTYYVSIAVLAVLGMILLFILILSGLSELMRK